MALDICEKTRFSGLPRILSSPMKINKKNNIKKRKEKKKKEKKGKEKNT